MKTTLKAKFKAFAEGPAPLLIITAAGTVTAIVLYSKFLEEALDLMAKSLDTTTDSIISALHPK